MATRAAGRAGAPPHAPFAFCCHFASERLEMPVNDAPLD